MKNLNQTAERVEKYVRRRVTRWGRMIETTTRDPRDPRGVRHLYVDCIVSLLAGVIAHCKALRDVEQLSGEVGLGCHGEGISDGALTHLLKRSGEHDLDALLVCSVKDMARRGELRYPGLGQSWVAIDGKYSILDHDCGGLAQKFEGDSRVYWRMGVLRAVLSSAPARPALGQWPMGPVDSGETDPEKLKHTGEITNLPPFVRWLREQYGDLASNFTLDAGLWSKEVFLSMDALGLGVLCGLKKNKPDLFAEVERVLRIERQRRSHQAETEWEPSRTGQIRRRLWRTTKLDGWNGWTHLRQVFVVEQTTRDHDGKDTIELRYFVTNTTTGMTSPLQLLRLVRQHWGIENDCNWTFDQQFGEDAGAWCTQNKAFLVLGVVRMIAYNLLQHLRKSHVLVQHQFAAPTPRPWRDLFELIYRCLLRLGSSFSQLLRPVARGEPRGGGQLRAAPAD